MYSLFYSWVNECSFSSQSQKYFFRNICFGWIWSARTANEAKRKTIDTKSTQRQNTDFVKSVKIRLVNSSACQLKNECKLDKTVNAIEWPEQKSSKKMWKQAISKLKKNKFMYKFNMTHVLKSQKNGFRTKLRSKFTSTEKEKNNQEFALPNKQKRNVCFST